MQVVVKTNGEALTNLKITNLYTNVDTYEHFDLDINFNNFEKVNLLSQNIGYFARDQVLYIIAKKD